MDFHVWAGHTLEKVAEEDRLKKRAKELMPLGVVLKDGVVAANLGGLFGGQGSMGGHFQRFGLVQFHNHRRRSGTQCRECT